LTAKLGFVAAELESTARVKELNEIGSYDERYELLEPYVDALTEIARSTEKVEKDVRRVSKDEFEAALREREKKTPAKVSTVKGIPTLRSFQTIFNEGRHGEELSLEAKWVYRLLKEGNKDRAEVRLSIIFDEAGFSGDSVLRARTAIDDYWISLKGDYFYDRIMVDNVLIWDKYQAEHGGKVAYVSSRFRSFSDILKDGREIEELSLEAVKINEYLLMNQKNDAIIELNGIFKNKNKGVGSYKKTARQLIDEYWVADPIVGPPQYSQTFIVRHDILLWDKYQAEHGGRVF